MILSQDRLPKPSSYQIISLIFTLCQQNHTPTILNLKIWCKTENSVRRWILSKSRPSSMLFRKQNSKIENPKPGKPSHWRCQYPYSRVWKNRQKKMLSHIRLFSFLSQKNGRNDVLSRRNKFVNPRVETSTNLAISRREWRWSRYTIYQDNDNRGLEMMLYISLWIKYPNSEYFLTNKVKILSSFLWINLYH